jgi:hypothetical protein
MTLMTSRLHDFWTLTAWTSMVSNTIKRPSFPHFIFAPDPKDPLDKAQLKELLYEEVISFVPTI